MRTYIASNLPPVFHSLLQFSLPPPTPRLRSFRSAVYLIESKATRSTYVGAVHDGDVLRRLAQHNGAIHGGVERLTAARPWRLVVWVKGFVGIRHALKFETAWQAGLRGRDLRHVRTTCGGNVSGKLRVLSSLLRAERWCPHHLRLSYVDRARATGRLENANLHVWTNVERVPADVRHG